MRQIVFILLGVFGSLNLMAAQIEIDDFMHGLDRVERDLKPVSFEEALKCGDSASFQGAKDMCTVSCERRGVFSVCQTLCIPPDLRSDKVKVEIVNCTKDSATLFGSDGDIQTITKEDFARFNNNPLRMLFEQIPTWLNGIYKVRILTMKRGEHTLGWKTANERKVPAWYFEGSLVYRSEDGSEQDIEAIFTLIDDETVPWFARGARVRLRTDGTMWRLDEI